MVATRLQAAWHLQLHLTEMSAGSCHSQLHSPSTWSQLRKPSQRRRRSQRRQRRRPRLPVAGGERRCCPPTRRQPVQRLQPWKPRLTAPRVRPQSLVCPQSSDQQSFTQRCMLKVCGNVGSPWTCRWKQARGEPAHAGAQLWAAGCGATACGACDDTRRAAEGHTRRQHQRVRDAALLLWQQAC